MLARFIIGGVALATTGYGLRKYMESDNDFSLEEIGSKFFDWLDNTERKTDNYLDNIVKKFDENSEKNQISTIEQIYISKETFYDEIVPHFLEIFSKIRNLPDFDMEQFYKLQKKFEKDNVNIEFLNLNTKENLRHYCEIYHSGIYLIQKLFDNFDNKSEDYHTYTKEQKTHVENMYLIAVSLIKLTYTETFSDNNCFSKKLNDEILVFKRFIENLYYSLKNTQNSTESI